MMVRAIVTMFHLTLELGGSLATLMVMTPDDTPCSVEEYMAIADRNGVTCTNDNPQHRLHSTPLHPARRFYERTLLHNPPAATGGVRWQFSSLLFLSDSVVGLFSLRASIKRANTVPPNPKGTRRLWPRRRRPTGGGAAAAARTV